MKIRRAPTAISALSVTGASVALALGAWCGPAFASADVKAPSPKLASHNETPLSEILANDEIASSTLRTIESTANQEDAGKKEDLTILKSDIPNIATRLPGVSISDSPRFRRHMYRTDI